MPGRSNPHTIDPVDVAIGERIRERRQALGVSQAVLGAAAGVSFQQVQKYERGTNRICASQLIKLAERLGVTVAYLVGEDSSRAEILPLRLATPGAMEILDAFARIESPDARKHLVDLLTSMAGGGGGGGTGGRPRRRLPEARI